MLEPSLSYVEGKVLIVQDFEIDHLDIASIHNVYKEINTDTSKSEHNEEGIESDTDGSEDIQDIANNLEVPKERGNHVHFNVDD